MASEKGDQPMRGGDIGADGMFGAAPVTPEMIAPCRSEGTRGMIRKIDDGVF
jgi:hypothetical protein